MAEPDPTLQVRWATLGAVFLVTGTLSAVGLRWWQSRGGDLPMIPLLLAGLLVLVAAVVAILGLRVRRWVSKREAIDAIGATRTLVLGQTAALAGAVLAGYLTASAALSLGRTWAPAPAAVALGSVVGLLAAALMAGAGMLAQWCCRVPPDDDGDDGPVAT